MSLFKTACDNLRASILSTDKHVEELVQHDQLSRLPAEARGEVVANLKLAHRHLEDARMRLGKAIQHSESRESIFDVQKDPEQLGKLAYQRYADILGGKNFQGDPMPTWEALSDKQREGWIAAGSVGLPVKQ